MKKTFATLLCSAAVFLTSCSEPCTGHIESTVLYFQEAPNHQGQLVYAFVQNKPDLGVKRTLLREGKEFGTFEHIIIIEDPQSKYKGRRTICFDTFTVRPRPAEIPANEEGIPQLSLP